MNKTEALEFIASLARGHDDSLYSREADELMDEMGVSEDLRELVVADVVGGQYTCDYCFPNGCGRSSEADPPGKWCNDTAVWREKETAAGDVWEHQGPVSRISLIQAIAIAAIAKAKGGA